MTCVFSGPLTETEQFKGSVLCLSFSCSLLHYFRSSQRDLCSVLLFFSFSLNHFTVACPVGTWRQNPFLAQMVPYTIPASRFCLSVYNNPAWNFYPAISCSTEELFVQSGPWIYPSRILCSEPPFVIYSCHLSFCVVLRASTFQPPAGFL